MTREEWFEKAITYFNNAMPAEEAKLFEKETAGDEALSPLMQLWKTTDADAVVFEQNKEDAVAFISTHQKLKPAFIDTEEEENKLLTAAHKNATVNPRFALWKLVAIAATITGIIVMVRLLAPSAKNETPFVQHSKNSDSSNLLITPDTAITLTEENKQKEKSPDPTQQKNISSATLYAQAFTADDVPENQDGPLTDAFFYYNSGQYKEAIIAIDHAGNETITRGDNTFTPLTNFYALYYKALSMMLLRNTPGAIPVLQQAIIKSPAEELKAKAQWYLALAYLKEEQNTNATATLRLLIKNPQVGTYKTRAEKLLSALSK